MPGDPKESRKHALTCTSWPRRPTALHGRKSLRTSPSNGLKLAVELEHAEGLLSEREPRLRKPPTDAQARGGKPIIRRME